jgi:hypothetical protein
MIGLSSHPPNTMQTTRKVSIVAVFTSLILATDYGLTPFLNVKLVDTLVFASAYSFGFRMGAYIAILSELVWSILNPYGFGGLIIPFLVTGELLYAAAGWTASKVWGMRVGVFSAQNFFLGAILAICAFVWDVETNIGTALIVLWPRVTLFGLIGVQVAGALFMVFHEVSDFALGSFFAPFVIAYFSKRFGRNLALSEKGRESLEVK